MTPRWSLAAALVAVVSPPAQPRVSAGEVDAIIAYVRERQRQAGITVDPSH